MFSLKQTLLLIIQLYFYPQILSVTVEKTTEKLYRNPLCPIGSPLGMEDGRIADSQITASTFEPKREPHLGRAGDQSGAWTASDVNNYQWLSIDLRSRHIITSVSTQGRKGSEEYVTEYQIQFSDDGTTWRFYSNKFNMPEVFVGNTESFKKQVNRFIYPIVARYIRFHPIRWATRISLRVELYGCVYAASTGYFSNGYIKFDVSSQTSHIQSEVDDISLRFRTSHGSGIIFYADGNQGDFIIIELFRGYLKLHINLGSTRDSSGDTSITGGSLLDDGQWHDVIVKRNKKQVDLIVDRLKTTTMTNGHFFRLDLDKAIFIGGLKRPKMQGLGSRTRSNFIGCIENVFLNNANLIKDAKMGKTRYSSPNVDFKCFVTQFPPVTFTSIKSYIEVLGASTSRSVTASLHFRTYNTNNLLVYALFNNANNENKDNYLQISINRDGHIQFKVKVGSKEINDLITNIDPDSTENIFNDGLWHKLHFYMTRTMVNCTVDGNSKISRTTLDISSAPTSYHIGGYSGHVSFTGCMRQISVDNKIKTLEELKDKSLEVSFGTCSILDRCIPNPCEHGGVCKQDWTTFTCNCDNTGYTGVTCRISIHPLSCLHFKMYSGGMSLTEKTTIDIDGSGPLKPFEVECSQKDTALQTAQTAISHNSMDSVKVMGKMEPGSYRHDVRYKADFESLTQVVERAYDCQQYIEYRCNSSKLLSKPENTQSPGITYKSYAWWIGRSEQPMYYWGGATFGIQSCACGLSELGCRGSGNNLDKPVMCNCDANVAGQSVDSGYIRDRDHLPVKSLYFGDTNMNTKIGWHKVGKLECFGDNLFDSVITFRKLDATLKLATFDAAITGDIWFQFKTTQQNGVILHNAATTTSDFIQIRILDGETMFFSYNSGAGTVNIQAKSASGLNDNRWHTVHIERNRKEASLKIDQQSPVTFNEEQSEGYRTLDLEGPLVLGANVDNRDGYVGCIRALMINGKLYNLRAHVEKNEYMYGVEVGCVGKCDSSPCFNGGTCIEEYKGYKCDCAYTPYRGWMCGRQVGANFNKGNYLNYTFDDSTGVTGAAASNVIIGFSTKLSQGILLQIRGKTSANRLEYISIEMDNNGGVKVAVDVGFGREEINTASGNIQFTNGQQHVVKFMRVNNGKTMRLQVDDYAATSFTPSKIDSTDTLLNHPKYMYIGNNSTDSSRGFEGCIYKVQFDNIYPLKDAFQDPPNPNVHKIGKIKEDMCGFEEVTRKPDPIEVRDGIGIKRTLTMPTPTDRQDEEWTIGKKIGVGIGAALALILIIGVIFYFLFRGGVYRTHEAYGADYTDNPDVALMYNEVGQPELSRMQEWFM